MGKLFTEEVGNLLTRLLGNYLTEALGKVLDIYIPYYNKFWAVGVGQFYYIIFA